MRKRKIKNKRNNKKIIILLIIILFAYFFFKSNLFKNLYYNFMYNILEPPKYEIIKQDKNKNYSGTGQEQIKNKDGYFTTFTTIENYKKTYIEYKQNGDSSWSNNLYWSGTMAENGCGITALSIILSGYNKNYTPESLRQKYYPVLNYDSLSKELKNTFKIENTDFYYDSVHLSKSKLIEHLQTNRPILICVWNKPNENRWTAKSHYMVLLATDNQDMVYISNPNGGKNDYKSSGWYNFEDVIPYIAKALYIESYN